MRLRSLTTPLALSACLGCFYSNTTAQEKVPERPTLQTQEPAAEKTEEEKKAKRRAMAVVPVAKAFIETLSDEQKEKALLAFDTEQRVKWHFIPMDTRKGVPVMEMSEEQKTAAMKLLRAAISKVGYEKATTIMRLESVLLELEGPKSEGRRNPEKYYFTFFDEPKFKKRWGLSIEGHHLSLNFVFQGNKVLDSTPQFFASNPAELKKDFGEGLEKGFRVLKAEEQLAFKLVRSLSDEQFAASELEKTPKEIRGAGEAQPSKEVLKGISVGEFSEEQIETLTKLMKAYTGKMKPLVAKERWEKIEKEGLGKCTFTWAGPKRPGVGHYYVIQGPTFVIEFINVQPDAAGNPANHIHCVWRDMGGDFDLPIEG